MKGEALLLEVTKATNLPEKLIKNELEHLVAHNGLSTEQVSLDDLRQLLADYLQDVFLKAQQL